MGMAARELVANRACNRFEIEAAGFACHLRMEHHLEQQISEFVLEAAPVAAFDGVRHFVGFLDGIGRDAREALLPVPGTAVG